MAALAGHEVKIYAVQQADTDSDPAALATYVEIGGIDSVQFGESRDQLDKTDFKNTEGARKRFLGLKDGSVSLSGYYDSADLGQAELRAGFTGGANDVVWFMVAFTGTPGDGTEHVKCTLEEYSRDFGVEDRVELSVSLQMSGAVSAGPTS